MRKRYQMVVFLLLMSVFLSGCVGKSVSEKEVTQIVWQTERNLKKHEGAFNELLKEKGLPYEVKFVSEKNNEENVDISDTGFQIYYESFDTRKEILEGKFLELDAYLDSERGAVIKNSLPQKVWDSYKVDGKQYTLLSVRYVPFQTAYIWDKELADKYDLHPENWDSDLKQYEESFRRVLEGEQGQVIPISNLTGYLERHTDLTYVLGILYPIVIRETGEDMQAELLYETTEYQERLEMVRQFLEGGLYKPEDVSNRDKALFLSIDTQFISKNAYESNGYPNYWDTHDCKILGQERLFELSCGAREIGIRSESQNPDQVFEFLTYLYEDIELTNMLMWGREGIDYLVTGNRVEGLHGEQLFGEGVGNALAGYAGVGEDEEKQSVYTEQYQKVPLSKINGFYFTGESCRKELDAVLQVSMELGQSDSEGIDRLVYEQDQMIQRYKDAGIEKVIDEWNRQYQQWKGR